MQEFMENFKVNQDQAKLRVSVQVWQIILG